MTEIRGVAAANDERRKHQRLRCMIRCEVQDERKPAGGLIRDVSQGGLSLQANLSVEQGDVLGLLIPRAEQRPEIYLQAIVWHKRALRSRRKGETSQILGLVLSEAPESYLELLESLRPGPPVPTPAALRGGRPEPDAGNKARGGLGAMSARLGNRSRQASPPKPKRFQVRVMMTATPRTRSIMVFAQTSDEARDIALREAGGGWIVLEVAAL